MEKGIFDTQTHLEFEKVGLLWKRYTQTQVGEKGVFGIQTQVVYGLGVYWYTCTNSISIWKRVCLV